MLLGFTEVKSGTVMTHKDRKQVHGAGEEKECGEDTSWRQMVTMVVNSVTIPNATELYIQN